tara:strand:- start:412 stop:771 length:360 start_codon:yes stop_codon:yes gene_type:complete
MTNKENNDSIRPWGRYFIIDDNSSYKIKRIEVEPKSRLSYQFHKKRSETWIIIQGEGVVTIEGKDQKIIQGDTITIPKTLKHRIENTGNNKLIFIEVQTGIYFGEDDIVRVEDDYNRIK